jgi:hypothetical protein
MHEIARWFGRSLFLFPLLLCCPALAGETASLEERIEAPQPAPNDPLFNPAGHLSGTFSTGIPYLAIGEIAYGFTDRFTLGAVGGITPDSPGAGLRLRAVLFQRRADRVLLSSLFLYYPASKASSDEPWVLAWPTVLYEHRFGGGASLHAGVGVVGATCTGVIGSLLAYGNFGHDRDDGDKGGFMGDVWLGGTIGGAVAVARATSLFSDVSVMSQGLAFDRHWLGTLPVVVTFGVEQTF